MARARTVGVVLFPGFELLDAFGPVDALSKLPPADAVTVVTVAEQGKGAAIPSAQGPATVADAGWTTCPKIDILLGRTPQAAPLQHVRCPAAAHSALHALPCTHALPCRPARMCTDIRSSGRPGHADAGR